MGQEWAGVRSGTQRETRIVEYCREKLGECNCLFCRMRHMRQSYSVARMKQLLRAGHSREATAHVISRELGHHRAGVLQWRLDTDPSEADRP